MVVKLVYAGVAVVAVSRTRPLVDLAFAKRGEAGEVEERSDEWKVVRVVILGQLSTRFPYSPFPPLTCSTSTARTVQGPKRPTEGAPSVLS